MNGIWKILHLIFVKHLSQKEKLASARQVFQNMDTLGKFVLIDLGIGLLFVVPTMINNFVQIKQRVNAIKKLK